MHLCCTGAFSHLPLHAAGDFDAGSGADGLFKHAVVSYTPTVTALLDARQSATTVRKDSARILLAAVQRGFQASPLACAIDEAQAIASVVPPNAIFSQEGNDSGAVFGHSRMQDVVDLLPQATILHMACHGFQNKKDSLASGFIMSDTVLTVNELLKLNLPNSHFAFLSACETAKADAVQPDQAVHLASTLLFAGFRSVIGTMWRVSRSHAQQEILTM